MSASGLPTPKKIIVNGQSLFVSLFSTDILLNVGTRTIKNRQISLPISFQANCRKLIQTKIQDIAKWFNPVPSREKLERVISTLPIIDCTVENLKDISNIVVRMEGIIVEDNRILPYLTITVPKNITHKDIVKSQDTLTEVVDLDLESESNDIVNLKNTVVHHNDYQDNDDHGDYNDNDDDDDDDDDDDEDDDDDDEDDNDGDEDTEDEFEQKFERVQRTLDSVREDLEALRRRHLAKKQNNRS
jgi:hypothetical protein